MSRHPTGRAIRASVAAIMAAGLLAAAGCGGSDSSDSDATQAESGKPAEGFDQGSSAASSGEQQDGKKVGSTRSGTARFSVGAGMKVSIVGGGGGTSNCTKDETNTTFTTKGNDEPHSFSFYSRGDGGCAIQKSWSYFKITVSDPSGKRVGSGDAWLGQDTVLIPVYFVTCGPEDSFQGVDCQVVGGPSPTADTIAISTPKS
jgi:hypothetical protein